MMVILYFGEIHVIPRAAPGIAYEDDYVLEAYISGAIKKVYVQVFDWKNGDYVTIDEFMDNIKRKTECPMKCVGGKRISLGARNDSILFKLDNFMLVRKNVSNFISYMNVDYKIPEFFLRNYYNTIVTADGHIYTDGKLFGRIEDGIIEVVGGDKNV